MYSSQAEGNPEARFSSVYFHAAFMGQDPRELTVSEDLQRLEGSESSELVAAKHTTQKGAEEVCGTITKLNLPGSKKKYTSCCLLLQM